MGKRTNEFCVVHISCQKCMVVRSVIAFHECATRGGEGVSTPEECVKAHVVRFVVCGFRRPMQGSFSSYQLSDVAAPG